MTGINPERFKEVTARRFADGSVTPRDINSIAQRVLGEVETLLFLSGGWQEYVQNVPARTLDLKHIVLVPPKKLRAPTVPPKPPCKYELHIVQYCSCPNIPDELAKLRHVRECGHEKQDGALCTRGPNNGKIIYCAECSFHSLNSEQSNE